MKPLNAEPKRNDSIVPSAATLSAPGTLTNFLPTFLHVDLFFFLFGNFNRK